MIAATAIPLSSHEPGSEEGSAASRMYPAKLIAPAEEMAKRTNWTAWKTCKRYLDESGVRGGRGPLQRTCEDARRQIAWPSIDPLQLEESVSFFNAVVKESWVNQVGAHIYFLAARPRHRGSEFQIHEESAEPVSSHFHSLCSGP